MKAKKVITIKQVLNENVTELYDLINKNQYKNLTVRVQQLLDDERLKTNKDVAKAKTIFTNCERNRNLYYSTLMTYITGIKVS